MVLQLEEGILEQEVAAMGIADRFGEEFVYTNPDGGLSIDRDVLKQFRKLTGDRVVWSRSELLWRFREPDDPPGRQVD